MFRVNYFSVLQCVAVCCSVLQCVAACCSVLQCVAVYCSVLQCVAVCCSVSQCVCRVFCRLHQLEMIVRSVFQSCCVLPGFPFEFARYPMGPGWLRLVCRGSLKLQVFFAKEPYKPKSSAKETCNFKEPINQSHPIPHLRLPSLYQPL